MLKLCEKREELAFLPADPFCAKITAYAITYGFSESFARFYRQDNRAALSCVDGNVTLYCSDEADFEEIKTFLPFLGCRSLQAGEEIFEKLGINAKCSSYIVRYAGEKAVKPKHFTDFFDGREIYSLLVSGGFALGTYNEFCESICARLNRGTAAFGGIKETELEACAFRLFDGDKSALLGAVTTSAKYRGRGLASSLVPYMAHKEKESFLFCREDSLLDFYKNCGFVLWGRWAENDEVIL